MAPEPAADNSIKWLNFFPVSVWLFVNGVIFGIQFDYNKIIIKNNQPKYCRHMYPFISLLPFVIITDYPISVGRV